MPQPKPDELALLIEGSRFRFWSEMHLSQHLDSYSSIELAAPYEADRKELRKAFRPFKYDDCDVLRGGKPLYTGTLVGVEPETTSAKRGMEASGYAKPGVLCDCTLPEDVKREFRKQDLRDIALAVTQDFGIDVEFRGDPGASFGADALTLAATSVQPAAPGAPFTKQKIGITQKVHDFLESLAQQRGFVMSNTPTGALLFWKAVTSGAPRARLRSGERPMVSVKPEFKLQDYYSHITGYSTSRRKRRSKYTVVNPWLSKYRPFAMVFDDVAAGDIPEATKAAMGRMFGNAISWVVEVPTHEDPQGALWEPNTIITLEAPEAMIYRETAVVIRSADLFVKPNETSAQLRVVLPGSFSGELPTELPWVE